MHHDTHEKQMSDVFAWLFDSGGTHELAPTDQRLIVAAVNKDLPADRHPFQRQRGGGGQACRWTESDTDCASLRMLARTESLSPPCSAALH